MNAPDLKDVVARMGASARAASARMAAAPTAAKNQALIALARLLRADVEALVSANRLDLDAAAAAGTTGPLLDRLKLTPKIIEKLPPPPTWVRAGRAIGVLEFVGTAEAVKVLEAVALGEDNAPPTKQAQDALARLKRKK